MQASTKLADCLALKRMICRKWLRASRQDSFYESLAIDFFAMANTEDQHQQALVFYLADEPVIS